MTRQSVSIGFRREDGDVQLLATLNNDDELLSDEAFEELVINTKELFLRDIDEEIEAWYRDDAPHYLDDDGSGFAPFKES